MQIKIPTNCPSCEYPLETVNDQLYCRNTACSARLDKQIEHFAKSLGIKGLGAKTAEKLNLADITELFYLDRDDVVEILGSEKVANKLLAEIESAKSADLAKVLTSFSIPLIGNTAANKICTVVSNIDEITLKTCKQAGLGDKATANLLSWLNTEFVVFREFLPFSFTVASKLVKKEFKATVCITGKLTSFNTKASAYDALQNAGFAISESVTKNVTYLVDEENRSSSKREKAESLGITIINNLVQFLEENKHD